jgi:hypothetical protein
MEDSLLELSISNGFFCLIIDTFNECRLWQEIFGHGSFKKISQVSEKEFPTIKSTVLFEVNEENIYEKEINIDE